MLMTGPVLHDASKWPLALGKRFDAGDRISTAGASNIAMLMTGPVLLGREKMLLFCLHLGLHALLPSYLSGGGGRWNAIQKHQYRINELLSQQPYFKIASWTILVVVKELSWDHFGDR